MEHALELLLLKDHQVIEAFLPHAPHEALADRIGSGCMIRRFQDLDGRWLRPRARKRTQICNRYHESGTLALAHRE